MRDETNPETMQRLLPVMMRIQAHLDTDLSLKRLAATARLSPYHFHRLFREAVGETPKQYTQRLRLERAAHRLVLHDATVLDIALDAGFGNHETFSREFKKRFRVTPRDYRAWGRRKLPGPGECRALEESARDYELSATRVRRLARLHLAFLRHTGPYEEVSDTMWQRLTRWARDRGYHGDLMLMGIGHDGPGITPPDKLRFDAAIAVPAPFAGRGPVGYQEWPGGDFAVTTHVGHFRTLPAAYGVIFQRLMRLKGYSVIGLPCLELYLTSQVNQQCEMNYTEICVPVARGRVLPTPDAGNQD